MRRISQSERARLRRIGFQKGHRGGWPLRGPSLAGRNWRRLGWPSQRQRARNVALRSAEKRQADFESALTSVDYDNDCAP